MSASAWQRDDPGATDLAAACAAAQNSAVHRF